MDSEGVLHAAWIVVDMGMADIFYSRSTDGGGTWSPHVSAVTGIYPFELLPGYVGICTDSHNEIFVTYCKGAFLYMAHSSDGVEWSEPSSPYEGPMPIGHHMTQAFPVITSDDVLHLFYIRKDSIFDFGTLWVVTYQ